MSDRKLLWKCKYCFVISVVVVSVLSVFYLFLVDNSVRKKVSSYQTVVVKREFPDTRTVEYDKILTSLRATALLDFEVDSRYDNLILADMVTTYKIVEILGNYKVGDFAQLGTTYQDTGLYIKLNGYGNVTVDFPNSVDNLIVLSDVVENPHLFGTLQELDEKDLLSLKENGVHLDEYKSFAKVYDESKYELSGYTSIGDIDGVKKQIEDLEVSIDLKYKKW